TNPKLMTKKTRMYATTRASRAKRSELTNRMVVRAPGGEPRLAERSVASRVVGSSRAEPSNGKVRPRAEESTVCAARRQAGTRNVGGGVVAFFWTFFHGGDMARASVCPSVPFGGGNGADPHAELSHEEALLAGGTYLSAKKWPEARGVYIWML